MQQNNYEVIRLIKQNADCHIIMDSAIGITIGELLMKNSEIEKEQFYSWMIQLIKEMECVEMAKGLPEYRFLTPFCVVIKENEKIALLNLRDKVNQKRVDKLFEQPIMRGFFPENGTYSDIYSFGKTMQYILAKAKIIPSLSKKEEKQFQKIISKCLADNSRNKYSKFEDILSDFIIFPKKEKRIRTVVLTIGAIILCVFAILKVLIFPQEIMSQDEINAYLETGLTYFVTMEDYEKSEEIFSHVKNSKIADYYEEMAAFMQGTSEKSGEEMEKLLEEYSFEINHPLDYEEKYCLLKVYSEIESESAKAQASALAEDILSSSDWKKNEAEVRELLEKSKIE